MQTFRAQLSASYSRTSRHALAVLVTLALSACGGGGGGSTSTTDTSSSTSLASSLASTSQASASSSVTVDANTLAYLQGINTTFLASGDIIENFDANTGADGAAVSQWTFSAGSEYAGASGSLVLGTDGSSRTAKLQADLNCGSTTIRLTPTSGCGKYVSATRTFSTAFAVSDQSNSRVLLRYRVSHPLLGVAMRLTDSSGQTLQYRVASNNLESVSGSSWAQAYVPLSSVQSYWSGANNGQIQTGIKGVSVLASQTTLTGAAANILIDEIRLLKNTVAELALTGQETLLTQGVTPTTTDRATVTAAYYKASDSNLKLASEAGFGVVRMDLFWSLVEQGGQFDFSVYDTILNRLAKYNMKALFILDYGHPDHGNGTPLSTQDRAAYVEFARRAAAFAANRNVVAFEVWNEPDNTTYWTDGNAQTYAQLLGEARAAIKTVDSTRKVVNGGVSWVNLPYILELAQTGKLSNLDAFAVHPYRGTNAPETFGSDLAVLKTVLASQSANIPVWVTEWGHSSYGSIDASVYGDGHATLARRWQAMRVLRSFLTQTSLNLPLMTVFQLVDAGTSATSAEENYGLLASDFSVKPAYTGLKNLYTLTKSRSYQGLLANVPPNVHVMKWTGSSNAYVVWMDSDNGSLSLSIPSAASITSWDGSAVSTTTSTYAKKVTLTSSDGPVFVTF